MEPYLTSYAHLSSRNLFRMLAFEAQLPSTDETRARFNAIRHLLSRPRMIKFRIARANYIEKEL